MFQIYKLKFKHAHFGQGLLETSSANFSVERIFSALVIESIQLDVLDEFIQLSSQKDFTMSDALFYSNQLYLQKPIGYPKIVDELRELKEGRKRVKQTKKLSVIPFSRFDDYCEGKIDDLSELLELEKQMTVIEYTTKVGENPFRVGVTHYNKDVYLAIIAPKNQLLLKLFESLQFSGLGGRRSTGFGQFELSIEELSKEFSSRIKVKSDKPVMLLNTALPTYDTIEKAMEDASYLLVRSGGFAYSTATKQNIRKKDLYKFKAGSTFKSSFEGEIIDVAPKDFPHPVYNFAKPMFLELGDALNVK